MVRAPPSRLIPLGLAIFTPTGAVLGLRPVVAPPDIKLRQADQSLMPVQ